MKARTPTSDIQDFLSLIQGDSQEAIIAQLKEFQDGGNDLNQLWILESLPYHKSFSAPEKPEYELHHFLTQSILDGNDQVVEWLLNQNIDPRFHFDPVMRDYSQYSNSILEPIALCLHSWAWNINDQDDTAGQERIFDLLLKHGCTLTYADIGTRSMPFNLFWEALFGADRHEMEQGWTIFKKAQALDSQGHTWHEALQEKRKCYQKTSHKGQDFQQYYPWETLGATESHTDAWNYIQVQLERQNLQQATPNMTATPRPSRGFSRL
jgi:hypothetical protein